MALNWFVQNWMRTLRGTQASELLKIEYERKSADACKRFNRRDRTSAENDQHVRRSDRVRQCSTWLLSLERLFTGTTAYRRIKEQHQSDAVDRDDSTETNANNQRSKGFDRQVKSLMGTAVCGWLAVGR